MRTRARRTLSLAASIWARMAESGGSLAPWPAEADTSNTSPATAAVAPPLDIRLKSMAML